MDVKLIFAIISSAILIIGFIPYFKDIFLNKTKPHLYTWLIWVITQGTATVAAWYGGGKFGVMGLAIGTLLVVSIFLLSFKYGTKDIRKTDTFFLITALLAILVWWQLKNPYLSVFMVSAIDGLGYFPTYRKSFSDPWSETLSFWLMMALLSVFALLALDKYNFLTVAYLATIGVADIILFIECAVRRLIIKSKKQNAG